MRMAHRGVEKVKIFTSKVVIQMIEERIQRLSEVGTLECVQKTFWMTTFYGKAWRIHVY